MKLRILTDSRGFSMMELAIVIAIVGILAVVSIPQITGAVEAQRLNSAAEKLSSDIRYVRELALSHHDTYGIEFDTGANSYTLFHFDGVSKTTIEDPHLATNMVIDFDTLSEYAGVSLSSASPAEIRINAFGQPMSNLNINLATTSTIVLAGANSTTRSIQVLPETGYTNLA